MLCILLTVLTILCVLYLVVNNSDKADLAYGPASVAQHFLSELNGRIIRDCPIYSDSMKYYYAEQSKYAYSSCRYFADSTQAEK